MSAEHHATDPKSLCTCKECQPTAKPLAQRVEEECTALQNQADCANDEELGEKDSESLECVRRIGLYRSQQTEIERLRDDLERARYAPMGDNHHNAMACPHCNPKASDVVALEALGSKL